MMKALLLLMKKTGRNNRSEVEREYNKLLLEWRKSFSLKAGYVSETNGNCPQKHNIYTYCLAIIDLNLNLTIF